jgi:lipoprotein-releasing system permease protein
VALPAEWHIASRYLWANPRQSALIAAAVGIGVSIIVFVPSVNLSFYNNLLNKSINSAPQVRVMREDKTIQRDRKAVLPDIQALPQTPRQAQRQDQRVIFADQTEIRRQKLLGYRSLMDALMRLPGVVAVAPAIGENVVVVNGNRRLTASLRGVDPRREQQVTDIRNDIRSGDFDHLASGQAFIGWRLADELGVSIGERFNVITADGRQSLKVVGLTDTGLYFNDIQDLYVNIAQAQRLLDLPGQVSSIGLKLADYNDADEVSTAVQRQFALKTRNWMEDNSEMLQQNASFRVIIGFINFLIIAAAASSITSMLIMTIANKSREIGILKAMGMTQGAIIRIFMTQAMLLSLLGAGLGLLGGQGIISIYNATPYAKATVMGIERQPVTINWEYAGIAIFYALLTSFFASLLPAWQAGRLDPVKAINQP